MARSSFRSSRGRHRFNRSPILLRRSRLDWHVGFDTQCNLFSAAMNTESCPTKLTFNVLSNADLVSQYGGKATVIRTLCDFWFQLPNTTASNCDLNIYTWAARAGTKVYETVATGSTNLWDAGLSEGLYHKVWSFGSFPPDANWLIYACPGAAATGQVAGTVGNSAVHFHFDLKRKVPLRGDQEMRFDLQLRPQLTNGAFPDPTPNLRILGYIKCLVSE